MKFVRFSLPENENRMSYGVLTAVGIKEIIGDLFGEWEWSGNVFSPEKVRLHAPLSPRQIIGIGANFVEKKADLPAEPPELPVFFLKPVSSVIAAESEIVIPEGANAVKFEAELAVIIGKTCKNKAPDEVEEFIFGYTVANDITAPDFFHSDGHWTLGKSFDTFTPLGPVIETSLVPENVRIRSYLNGQEKQNSPASYMIMTAKSIVSYLSHHMTLAAGDVILTGSPAGAGFLRNGDEIVCEIEEIGVLKNQVKKMNQAKEKEFLKKS